MSRGLRARELGLRSNRRVHRVYHELAPFDGDRRMRLLVSLSPIDGHVLSSSWIVMDFPHMVDHDMEFCFALFAMPGGFNELQSEWPAVAQDIKYRRFVAGTEPLSICVPPRTDIRFPLFGCLFRSDVYYLDIFQSIVYYGHHAPPGFVAVVGALRRDAKLPCPPCTRRLVFGYNREQRTLLVYWRAAGMSPFDEMLQRFVDVPAGTEIESGSIHEPELIAERQFRFRRLAPALKRLATPSQFYDGERQSIWHRIRQWL